MSSDLLKNIFNPRTASAVIAWVGISLLSFGIYLQEVVGLEPCPMCIVQRYAFILIVVFALLGYFLNKTRAFIFLSMLVQIFAVFGAFVAARQSWLQWFHSVPMVP